MYLSIHDVKLVTAGRLEDGPHGKFRTLSIDALTTGGDPVTVEITLFAKDADALVVQFA